MPFHAIMQGNIHNSSKGTLEIYGHALTIMLFVTHSNGAEIKSMHMQMSKMWSQEVVPPYPTAAYTFYVHEHMQLENVLP